MQTKQAKTLLTSELYFDVFWYISDGKKSLYRQYTIRLTNTRAPAADYESATNTAGDFRFSAITFICIA